MTIKEVARLAGVSPAAVSRYLNGGSISRERAARVKQAIEETGFRPNPMAQTMRTGRINQVGIIVPRIYSDSVSQITAGAARVLAGRGFMAILGCTGHDPEKELQYLLAMQESQAAGIILMGTVLSPPLEEALAACRIPVVITGQDFAGYPCVFHDDYHAARDLARLLTARGRRRIAMVAAPDEDIAAGKNRRLGVEAALAEAGLDPGGMPVETSSFEAEGGREAMRRLLGRRPDIDGVVCATDTMAMGALGAIREAGLRVPGDISIVGVGDSWVDGVSTPPLTTARLFFGRCGEDAARILTGLIGKSAGRDGDHGEPARPRRICLPYRIMERGSV